MGMHAHTSQRSRSVGPTWHHGDMQMAVCLSGRASPRSAIPPAMRQLHMLGTLTASMAKGSPAEKDDGNIVESWSLLQSQSQPAGDWQNQGHQYFLGAVGETRPGNYWPMFFEGHHAGLVNKFPFGLEKF